MRPSKNISNTLQEDFCKARNVDQVAFEKALRHVCSWAEDLFPNVVIYEDGGADFIAVYRYEDDGRPPYVIGAIYHREDDSYTFHS